MNVVLKYLSEEESSMKDMLLPSDRTRRLETYNTDYWRGCLDEVKKIIRRIRELEEEDHTKIKVER